MPGAAPYWQAIDWSRPWLAPWRERGKLLTCALQRGLPLIEALSAQLDATEHRLAAGALRFVPQAELPIGQAYEAFIARTAGVPTRENRHDLFNGLMWLHDPRLKRRLNELQAAEIARQGMGTRRGAVRDALTIFDENGAWWQAPPVLADALRAHDWRALFVTHRDVWRTAPRPRLFGHALLDKLVAPRKAITAHVWLVPEGGSARAQVLDAITPEALTARPHSPLPVLGVPAWWPANDDPTYYDDEQVFRPAPREARLTR